MTRPLPWASESAEDVSESQALEAFARAMTMMLASLPARRPARPAEPMPMPTVQQTAALLGMSRMTVIRKAEGGSCRAWWSAAELGRRCDGSRVRRSRNWPRVAVAARRLS